MFRDMQKNLTIDDIKIHSTIDKKKVLPVLKDKMNDERFLGRVEATLDDINMFTDQLEAIGCRR